MTELEKAIKELAEEKISLADMVELSGIVGDLRGEPMDGSNCVPDGTLAMAARTIEWLVKESHDLRKDRDIPGDWFHQIRFKLKPERGPGLPNNPRTKR